MTISPTERGAYSGWSASTRVRWAPGVTLDEGGARTSGWACARSPTTDVVDASVVIGTLRRDDACVTSDPGDLAAIADALGRPLRVFAI